MGNKDLETPIESDIPGYGKDIDDFEAPTDADRGDAIPESDDDQDTEIEIDTGGSGDDDDKTGDDDDKTGDGDDAGDDDDKTGDDDDAGDDDDDAGDDDDKTGDDDDDAGDDDDKTGDDDDDKGGDDKKRPPEKGHWIPKSRFDTVNQRRKQAEQKARELEERLAAQDKGAGGGDKGDSPSSIYTDEWFAQRDKELVDAIADGDSEKALAAQSQIRKADRELAEERLNQTRSQATQEADIQSRVNTAIERLVELNEVFDDTSDSFDEKAVARLTRYQRVLMSEDSSITPDLALLQAAEELGFKVDEGDFIEDDGGDGDGKKPDPKKSKEVKAERKQVKRKIEAKDKQPPRGQGDSDKGASIKLSDLTEEQLEALPESKLRELRGDFDI